MKKVLAPAAPMPDLTPKEAKERLGLQGSTFWRVIWKGVEDGIVKVIPWGRRCFRFDAASIEALRQSRIVTSTEGLRALADGRRFA